MWQYGKLKIEDDPVDRYGGDQHNQEDDGDDDSDGVVREVMMGMVGPHGSIVGTPRSQ